MRTRMRSGKTRLTTARRTPGRRSNSELIADRSARQTPVRATARRVRPSISSAEVRDVPVTSMLCIWNNEAEAAARYPTTKVITVRIAKMIFNADGTYPNSTRGEKLLALPLFAPPRRAGRCTKPLGCTVAPLELRAPRDAITCSFIL